MKKAKMQLTSLNDIQVDSPGNAEVERLVAKLTAMSNGEDKHIYLITSAVLGEGKSTLSHLIARSMASNKKKPTLIIDFDIRRPTLHKIFNVEKDIGITDYLRTGKPPKNFYKKTNIPNLYIVTAGKLKENPMSLFKSDTISNMFVEIKKYYDNIIVDCPPVIPVSDSLVLCKEVDKVLLVIKAGMYSRNIYKRVVDMFYDVKVNIDGVILNNVDNILPYQYDSKYYGYDYYQTEQF